MYNKPVRQPSVRTLLSRPKLDTETRDEVIATFFVHYEQMNATVRRLESMIKMRYLGLALARADPSLSSARQKGVCLERIKYQEQI